MRNSSKISPEIENSICMEFSTTGTQSLANKYNIAVSSIYNILRRNKIDKLNIHKNRKYTLNEDYFEKIDSEDKAYFLGLLYADGNINPDNNTIRLRLQERDKYILEKFSEKCGSNRPIRLNKLNNVKWQDSSDLSLSSIKMFNDIQNKGCFINKTFTLNFPTEKQVPNYLIRHFIRGVFDGDGCVNSSSTCHKFSIIGTRQLLEGIQKVLIKECNLKNKTKITVKHKTNNIVCTLAYGGARICTKIKMYLYKDATIYLTRKKEKFDKIIPKKSVSL